MVLQCNLFVQINLSTQYYTKKKISVPMKQTHYSMENALYDFYSLVDTYQKTQLVNKNRTRAFSMK